MSQPLTEAQSGALEVVPRVLAALSVLGSGSILISVVRNLLNPNNNECSVSCARGSRGGQSGYRPVLGQKLLLGMSVADLLSSFSYVIGDVAFPVEDGGKGNQTTCNLQGFLCNLQVGGALYSGFLAWFYCLYIRYQWRPDRLARVFEPWAHLISWAFVASTGIASIAMELYHGHWIRCFITGPNTNGFVWAMFFLPIWASMVCGSLAMLLIFCKVRETEARSLRFTFHRQQSLLQPSAGIMPTARSTSVSLFRRSSTVSFAKEADLDLERGGPVSDEVHSEEIADAASTHNRHHNDNCNTNASDDDQQSRELSHELSLAPAQHFSQTEANQIDQLRTQLSDLPVTRRVACQGLWYTGCFLLVYIFPTISRTWSTVDTDPPYGIRILAASLVGSQGFFNFCVYYLQPRVYDWFEERRKRFQNTTSHRAPVGFSSGASASSLRLQLQQHQDSPDAGELPPPQEGADERQQQVLSTPPQPSSQQQHVQ